MGSSRWWKVRSAMGLSFCVNTPRTASDELPPETSAAALATSTVSISSHKLAKNPSRSSKGTCAICLGTIKAGRGLALFTAECSHTFHFHCITSNVKHGNHICPICRAKWSEVPFCPPAHAELPPPARNTRVRPIQWSQDEVHLIPPRRIPRSSSHSRFLHHSSGFRASEPSTFDDDEALDPEPQSNNIPKQNSTKLVTCNTYSELSAVPCSESLEKFAILVHLKAPVKEAYQTSGRSTQSSLHSSCATRAPIDLVTILDVSGSMSGTKLALLKRAMGFVIQNLEPSDRLSVISFSSTARRVFALRRMSESGKQLALQAVNALVSCGGTNIAEGLRKGAKVIEDRKVKNPVCNIILLSDGHDTYTVAPFAAHPSPPDYKSLLPYATRAGSSHYMPPIHAFGFGSDHDAALMHSISDASGGTFSFIEAENVIQDAFAQCIGGLLSVVVQELHVQLQCVHPSVRIDSIKSGRYTNLVTEEGRQGSINVGDLYADEERDFLVLVNVPPSSQARVDTMLLKVNCAYKDSISKEAVKLEGGEVMIRRPEVVATRSISMEVDRQRNRLLAAEAIADAKSAAERGSFAEAVSILEKCRQLLGETQSVQSGDRLCAGLDAELKEMQERMASRQQYELSGRAYVLSGLSSHSWQRATARGDSTDSTSLVQTYQTPSMVYMLMRSQTMVLPPNLPNGPSGAS